MTDRAEVTGEMQWTHPSVRALAGDADPLSVITDRARTVLFAALDAGLTGPPFDPFALAKLLGLGLRAHADVADARIGPAGNGEPPTDAPLARLLPSGNPLAIEYNPTRPRGRLRYNVAHEIAHALFPDVHLTIRHRTGTGALPGYTGDDSWQLELLCNVAAAELLMPTDAVAGLVDIDPDIDFLMATRARFDVSTEALLRRLAYETRRPMAVVATSRLYQALNSPLRVEYIVPSKMWAPRVTRGTLVGPDGPFGEPTAVGQTARGQQQVSVGEQLRAQTVGVPAYPGGIFPRVLGLVEPADAPRTAPEGIRYVAGDVTQPDADGPLVVAHVVSDSARAWSRRGVGRALAARFPTASSAFHYWSIAAPDNLVLGNVHFIDVGRDRTIVVASMVAQHGYGPTTQPRLVYQALAAALQSVAAQALRAGASVHLPRIGAGEAGGRWDLIEQEIERSLVRAGIPVTVYTPQLRPHGRAK